MSYRWNWEKVSGMGEKPWECNGIGAESKGDVKKQRMTKHDLSDAKSDKTKPKKKSLIFEHHKYTRDTSQMTILWRSLFIYLFIIAWGRATRGCRRPSRQPSPLWLFMSNMIISSVLSQPERLIWNLCSFLLENILGNTCQEQRRIVMSLLLPNTYQFFREGTCSSCSKPGHSRTPQGVLSSLTPTERPPILRISPELRGRGNADFSS